eukprot:scaffold19840_cov124-Isochrysis_galbana.AAC.1
MEAPQGVQALLGVMECGNNSFVNMLEPLRQIVYNSPPVNRALGKLDGTLGISPFVQSLVKRLSHPDALVRRLLLDIMTSLYEHHRSPKLLVERHRLKPVLSSIIERDPGVLVQNVAGRLYRKQGLQPCAFGGSAGPQLGRGLSVLAWRGRTSGERLPVYRPRPPAPALLCALAPRNQPWRTCS